MDTSIVLKTFIKRLTLKTLIVAAICAAVFYFFAQQYYFHFAPLIFLYFYMVNIIVFSVLIKSHNQSTAKFSRRFLIVTMLKFLGSLIFAVLFMFFAREHMIPFLVIFIILYFLSLSQVVREFLGFVNQKK